MTSVLRWLRWQQLIPALQQQLLRRLLDPRCFLLLQLLQLLLLLPFPPRVQQQQLRRNSRGQHPSSKEAAGLRQSNREAADLPLAAAAAGRWRWISKECRSLILESIRMLELRSLRALPLLLRPSVPERLVALQLAKVCCCCSFSLSTAVLCCVVCLLVCFAVQLVFSEMRE